MEESGASTTHFHTLTHTACIGLAGHGLRSVAGIVRQNGHLTPRRHLCAMDASSRIGHASVADLAFCSGGALPPAAAGGAFGRPFLAPCPWVGRSWPPPEGGAWPPRARGGGAPSPPPPPRSPGTPRGGGFVIENAFDPMGCVWRNTVK